MLIVIAGLLAYPYVFGSEADAPANRQEQPTGASSDEVAPRLGEQSVAVLPFTYLAATDSADYFSLGMTDELLSRLAQIEGLSVIARTSVMQFRGGGALSQGGGAPRPSRLCHLDMAGGK